MRCARLLARGRLIGSRRQIDGVSRRLSSIGIGHAGEPAMGAEELLYEVTDGIAYVTLNRVAVRNALTFAMYQRLAAICREVDADHEIKALVLTGAGDKAFTSGTDISEFTSLAGPEDALDYATRVNRVIDALERCRVPTIAAIAGACTNAGVTLAAACDLRIAAPNARFGIHIARTVGACMSQANLVRLAALIGPARVKDLVFRAGAVAEVVEIQGGVVSG
jgi:enoyl-CoA hydratase